MTRRYSPVRETTYPMVADVREEPSEKGSILSKKRLTNHHSGRRCLSNLTPAPVAEDPRIWKYTGN